MKKKKKTKRGAQRPNIDIDLSGVGTGSARTNIDVDISGAYAKKRAPSTAPRSAIDIDITGAGTARPSPPNQNQRRRPPPSTKKRGTSPAPRKTTGTPRRQTEKQPQAKQRPTAAPPLGAHGQARLRRRRRRLMQTGLLLVLLLAGLLASFTVLFPITEYRITGETQYSLEQMVQAFGHAEGENIFRFRIADAEQAMSRALPYLESIKVRRRLPGTVVFIVEPATECYFALLEDTGVVLSQSMRVLRLCDQAPPGLCVITGIGGAGYELGMPLQYEQSASGQTLIALTQAIAAAGLERVTAIDISDALRLSITYDARVLVNFGTISELEYKVVLAKEVLTTKIGDAETGTLDASAPGKTVFAPH
ncbi:FtsQ-type POTRA domain-containing protein [Ruminococcaceae bacterium OttesenSCG-928-N02]|nr:FtsQ-type POTRA domain-containing protein [Ruminococcaceae bacterium OttesenSCG-928-N02]